MLTLEVCPHTSDLLLWITAALTVSSSPSETAAAERHRASITKERLRFIPGLCLGLLPGRDYLSHLALELPRVPSEKLGRVAAAPREPNKTRMEQIAFYHSENQSGASIRSRYQRYNFSNVIETWLVSKPSCFHRPPVLHRIRYNRRKPWAGA